MCLSHDRSRYLGIGGELRWDGEVCATNWSEISCERPLRCCKHLSNLSALCCHVLPPLQPNVRQRSLKQHLICSGGEWLRRFPSLCVKSDISGADVTPPTLQRCMCGRLLNRDVQLTSCVCVRQAGRNLSQKRKLTQQHLKPPNQTKPNSVWWLSGVHAAASLLNYIILWNTDLLNPVWTGHDPDTFPSRG